MSLPLAGKTVLVTRPKHQAPELIRPLEALGARAVVLPAIEIAPPEDPTPLDEALRRLDRYDWVVLTSVNGVEAVRQRMEALELPDALLSHRKLAVIGPATGAALAAAFRAPDVVPAEFVSEAIAEALGDVRGQRFLLARADIARRDLAQILAERGAIVDEVAAYRIVRAGDAAFLPEEAPDYITLTSSAAARGTSEALREQGKGGWMAESALVCIGPITAATVRELGHEPAVVAERYTVSGLVEALVEHQRLEKTNA